MSIPVWNKSEIEKDSPPLYLLVTQSIEGANSSKSRRPFHEGGKGSSSFLDETQRGMGMLMHRGGKGENVVFVPW